MLVWMEKNKLASLEATLIQNYNPASYSLTVIRGFLAYWAPANRKVYSSNMIQRAQGTVGRPTSRLRHSASNTHYLVGPLRSLLLHLFSCPANSSIGDLVTD